MASNDQYVRYRSQSPYQPRLEIHPQTLGGIVLGIDGRDILGGIHRPADKVPQLIVQTAHVLAHNTQRGVGPLVIGIGGIAELKDSRTPRNPDNFLANMGAALVGV